MKLLDLIIRFRNDEDGAVTVDWVVLTAGIVAVGIGIAVFLSDGIGDLAQRIGTEITTFEDDLEVLDLSN